MSSGPERWPPFRLECSESIAESIRRLQRRASREGRGEEFLEALRQTIDRLQTDPTDLGEPRYDLPALRMQVRCVVIRPLSIDFGVCEDRRLVVIKSARLMSFFTP